MRMKNYMRKSAAFSHVFFTFAFSFLLFLCFFRYLRLPLVLSVLFALAAACCVAALIAAFLGRKRRKFLFSLRAEKEKNALALYLSVVSGDEILRFFAQAFPERFSFYSSDGAVSAGGCGTVLAGGAALTGASVVSAGAGLVSVGENLFFLRAPQSGDGLKNGEPEKQSCPAFFFSFSAKNFGVEKAENLLRTLGGTFGGVFEEEAQARNKKSPARAQLYCAGIEEESAALLETFGVKSVAIDEIFAAAKTRGALPEAVETLANEKKARGFRLRAVSQKAARGLLISAGILLFTSLFSPFPYYYRAMGLILLALSLAVRLLATGAKLPSFRRAPTPPENHAPEDNSHENAAAR